MEQSSLLMSSTETIATSHTNKTPRRKQHFQFHSDSSCLSPGPGKLRPSLQSISSQRSVRSSMGVMGGYSEGCGNSINSAAYKFTATPGTRGSCGRSTVGSLRLTSPHSASVFSLQSLATTQSGVLGRHGNKRRSESSLNRSVLLPDELDGLAIDLGVNIDAAKGIHMNGKEIGGSVDEKDKDTLILSDNDSDESTVNSDGAMSLNDDVVFKHLAKDDKEDAILFDCKGSLLTEHEIYHPPNPLHHPHSHSHNHDHRDNVVSLPNKKEDAVITETFTVEKVGLGQHPVSSSSPVLQHIKLPTVNVSHDGQEQVRKQDSSIPPRKKVNGQNSGTISNSSPNMKSLLNSPYATSRTNKKYGSSKKNTGLTKKGSFVF